MTPPRERARKWLLRRGLTTAPVDIARLADAYCLPCPKPNDPLSRWQIAMELGSMFYEKVAECKEFAANLLVPLEILALYPRKTSRKLCKTFKVPEEVILYQRNEIDIPCRY